DHVRAVKYLALCVAGAQRRFAHREAITYGNNALSLLRAFPETSDRHRTELEIRLLQGVSLNVTRGYLSAEVRENYERARTLCEELGNAPQLFETVHALWYPQLAGSDEAGARRGIDELVRIAGRVNTADVKLRAELARGRVELWSGHVGAAV